MRTLVIIPAYNEAENIRGLIRQLVQLSPRPDILVVNDASHDDTAELAKHERVLVVNLPVNLGIGGAMQTGYLYAHRHGYDAAVQVDGDGQHDPAFIPRLIAPLAANTADLVVGSRFMKAEGFQSSFTRRIGIGILRTLLGWVTGQRFSDPTSGFRAANLKIIALFAAYYPQDYPEPESLVTVSSRHFRIHEIPVVMQARQRGSSSIVGWRSVYYMFKVCLAIIIEKLKKNRSIV